MKRTMLALAILFGVVLSPIRADDEDMELKSGIRKEGELNEKDESQFNGFPVKVFAKEYSVNLRAGQSITMAATVLGKNRLVGIAIFDPAGRPIDATRDINKAIKATQLVVEEVNATGEYKVIVGSEKIGAYTLEAKFATPAEAETKAIEARLKALKTETETLEARLKALKMKK
jgi:hypothetical protein